MARIGLTGSRTWFADATGQEVLSYPVGGTAHVRVEDQNRNQPRVWDTVYVELHSLGNGDMEWLQLRETARDSGIFAISLELANGTPQTGDGKLQVTAGSQIEAIHQDAYGATASSAVADVSVLSITFIDESGEPTAELLEKGDAGVRMFYLDGNFSSSTAEIQYVTLQALRSNDTESLMLTETVPNTGVFEGVHPMQVGGGYSAAGESVRLRVVDHNFNQPSTRDNVGVTLTSRDGADSQTLALTETGFDTAVLEGSLPTTFGGTATPSDNRLRVYSDDVVEARYEPNYSPNEIVATAAITGNAVLFVDAAGQPATVYLESSRAYVRVVSTNANSNPSSTERVPVLMVAELSGDDESLMLTETGPNTGVFEGSIQMRLAPGSPISGNGILETAEDGHPTSDPPHEFDTLRVSYYDPAGSSVATIGLTGSRTWFGDAAGTEVLSYATGGTAHVRVEDQNFNIPGQVDQAVVELHSSSGDDEFLNLSETSPDSGIFAGSIELVRDTPQTYNGQLYATPGDQIEVIHQDAYGATSSSAVADIVAAQITFINLRGQEVGAYALGSTLGLRVIDTNRNTDPGQTDSFQGSVRSLISNDIETLTLTETGPDTGIFEGTVPSTGTGSPGADGVLVAPPGQIEAEHMSTPNPLLRRATILSTPAPVATDDTATTVEDTQVVIPVVANDVGADPLYVVAASQPAHGSAAVNDMSVAYMPAAGYVGPDTFTYVIVDAQGGEAVATVVVTVTPANRAPVANPDTATTLEDQSVIISVLANDTDPDNDTLDVTAVTQGANGSVVLNANDTVTYTPNANFSGTDSFTYTISDGNGGTATATVTVTITAENDSPVANADSATVAEDGSVSITVLANDTDPENDTLDVTAITQGTNGPVVLNANDTVTYTPHANFSGTDSFTYTISDGNGGTATGTVTITVTADNDGPTANADTATVAEDGSVTVTVLANDTDPENDTLDVTAVTQGTNGSVVLNANDTVTYTPNANFSGTDSFTYTISDGNGGTATASVSVSINNVNDAPVANSDTASLAEDTW